MLQDRASRYLALTATLVMLLLPVPADAHGGVYRGPGATVGPGGATGGGPSANTGGFADTDPAAWSQWWSFNRDRYLALRDAVFHGGPSETGFDDFFLGHGSGARWGAGLRPTEDVLQGQVVPALLAALERQKDTDIITACLLALAKVGDPPSGPPRVAQVIRPWIAHGNQEVHETATIAIGVLASAEGATLLADLLLDRPAGRAAAGRGRVPERTRAFAAYGLALIGYRARTDAVRRYVVHELAQAVNGGDQPSRDPMVAAIIGMGMVRLAPGDGEPDPEEPPAVSASREGQLTFLFEHWESRRLDPRVRAHIAVPLARLADGAHPTWKTRVVDSFRGTLAPQSKAQPMVQHGALMGAGLLGDNDQDPDDQRLRQALMQVVGQGGDRLARHLALLSLGRVGAREGAGDAGGGPSEARTLLMRALARGQSAQRPWAALAIGLLERGNVAAGRPPADATRRALLDAYDKAASPSERGALAVALGLMAERRGAAALLESTTNGDENLRANAMLALGLMGATEAAPTLRKIVSRTDYRPGLVRDAAIALALLGDKSSGGVLVGRLLSSKKLFEQLAVTWALGFVGDGRTVPTLIQVLSDERENDTTRAYAAVGLGSIGDKERFPWNSKLAADVLWWQAPPTLFDPANGKGILDLL